MKKSIEPQSKIVPNGQLVIKSPTKWERFPQGSPITITAEYTGTDGAVKTVVWENETGAGNAPSSEAYVFNPPRSILKDGKFTTDFTYYTIWGSDIVRIWCRPEDSSVALEPAWVGMFIDNSVEPLTGYIVTLDSWDGDPVTLGSEFHYFRARYVDCSTLKNPPAPWDGTVTWSVSLDPSTPAGTMVRFLTSDPAFTTYACGFFLTGHAIYI
ncbi:hypothetical protein GCM10011491_46890 [Brucella endophytica]|uniref:Uncharacterized protein n=1 Tax=Brucella endophytica TaxID=1963359 RepID=A0A916SU77_9HYPH|nr:hypothetical protein [Brucella endophytica]GGB13844.1 hypothetical protein GCM10011491_46890 [Brucella endophytica]